MPATTPANQIPYPVPTDPINAYPALAGQAANAIEAALRARPASINAEANQLRIQGNRAPVPFTDGRVYLTYSAPFLVVVVAALVSVWHPTAVITWKTDADKVGVNVTAHDISTGTPVPLNGSYMVDWLAIGA